MLIVLCGCSTTASAPAFQAGNAGSIPVVRFVVWDCSSAGLERTPDKGEVGGSSPLSPILLKDYF